MSACSVSQLPRVLNTSPTTSVSILGVCPAANLPPGSSGLTAYVAEPGCCAVQLLP